MPRCRQVTDALLRHAVVGDNIRRGGRRREGDTLKVTRLHRLPLGAAPGDTEAPARAALNGLARPASWTRTSGCCASCSTTTSPSSWLCLTPCRTRRGSEKRPPGAVRMGVLSAWSRFSAIADLLVLQA
jgi:hypothetical protein